MKPSLTKREYFILELAKRMPWYEGAASYQMEKLVYFVDSLLEKLDKEKEEDSK